MNSLAETITNHAFFHGMKPEHLAVLTDGAKAVLFKVGDVLGWSWLFPPFSWNFQARAIEPTSAIVLSGAHLLVTAEGNHDFGYELMKRVAQVVIHRLQATRKQLLAIQVESALEG